MLRYQSYIKMTYDHSCLTNIYCYTCSHATVLTIIRFSLINKSKHFIGNTLLHHNHSSSSVGIFPPFTGSSHLLKAIRELTLFVRRGMKMATRIIAERFKFLMNLYNFIPYCEHFNVYPFIRDIRDQSQCIVAFTY